MAKSVKEAEPEVKPESVSQEDRKTQAEQIISLMEGGMSERSACVKVGVSRSTFRSAVLRCQVADQYARALESLAHDQVEKIEKSLRDTRRGVIDVQVGRLEVDTRKWLASKFLPKKYGDKITQEHTGEGGGPVRYQNMQPTELDAEIARLQGLVGPVK